MFQSIKITDTRPDRSKRIASCKNVFDRYLHAWISFNDQQCSKLELTGDLVFAVKGKVLNDIIFETLSFRVYDHLLFCNRYFYEKFCCFCTRFHIRGKVLSHFLNQKMTLPVQLFSKELLSVFVIDDVSYFVYYNGIIYSACDNNFENNYGNFRVIYYESVNSVFMLCKTYP